LNRTAISAEFECEHFHPAIASTETLQVNGEEVAILLFVLLLWAGAIWLFYHQWGKIRGIDDYQPDYVHANMTIHPNPFPEEGSEIGACANSVVMSPKLDSPRSIVAITNRLGYGRLGRRASRSLADLNALTSYQQQRNAGFFPKRKYLLHEQKIAESTKSVDNENSQIQGLNRSYEEQSYESDLYKPKMDNARIRMMKESEFTNSTSYDKDISKLEQGQSSLALNKISSRPFSPDPFHHSQQHQIPLTKGYMAAANRNLAVSTLKLWQDKPGSSGFPGSGEARTNLGAFAGDKVKRKAKSVYNLNDCNV